MEIRDYIRILRKSWILIVCLVLAGVAAAAVASLLATPKYQAQTSLFVSVQTSDTSTNGDLVQGSSFAQQKVASYVATVSSARVLEPVIKKLKLDVTPSELASQITASSPLNTVLVNIEVRASTPQGAANIANAVGESFRNLVVNDLEEPTGGGPSPVKIETIQPATAPAEATSPNTKLNLALGLLVGLALGIGAAVLRSTLDTRIHSSDDVSHVTESPVVGGIIFDPDYKKQPLVVQADPHGSRAESFRTLRTNLQFINVDNGPRTFVMTSSVASEGKTTTAVNLGIALAETGARVVIVDGDLRLPRVAEVMGLEGAVGLTDVLIGHASLADVLQKWGRNSLSVLPAGQVPPNPSELLGSSAMHNLLKLLGSEYDYVVIDAPPLLPVTDAAVLSRFVGGAIMVCAAGRTRKNELAAAIGALENIGSHVFGVVLTMLPVKGSGSYGYGAYSYYGGSRSDAASRVLAAPPIR